MRPDRLKPLAGDRALISRSAVLSALPRVDVVAPDRVPLPPKPDLGGKMAPLGECPYCDRRREANAAAVRKSRGKA